MSFGRPPQLTTFTVLPPDRGSFPLDHDGECKAQMLKYMTCLKANNSNSAVCREDSQAYLECRMQCGLMERDDWRNLGLSDVAAKKGAAALTAASTSQTAPDPKQDATKGKTS